MASEWYDYKELKNYLYELWESEEWDKQSQDVKRVYWRDLKKLCREANADMEPGSSDEEAFLCALQPNGKADEKKTKKKRKKWKYLRAYSMERAIKDGIDYPYSFTPEDAVIQQETIQELYAAINTLGKNEQIVIYLHLEGLSDHQISAQTGVAQTTVSYRRRAGIQKLKKIMEKNQ